MPERDRGVRHGLESLPRNRSPSSRWYRNLILWRHALPENIDRPNIFWVKVYGAIRLSKFQPRRRGSSEVPHREDVLTPPPTAPWSCEPKTRLQQQSARKFRSHRRNDFGWLGPNFRNAPVSAPD